MRGVAFIIHLEFHFLENINLSNKAVIIYLIDSDGVPVVSLFMSISLLSKIIKFLTNYFHCDKIFYTLKFIMCS